MANKELRKLKRLELLDLMIEQGKQMEAQEKEIAALKEQLQEMEVRLQASKDHVGHLKSHVSNVDSENDRLREVANTAQMEKIRASEDAKTLRQENADLTDRLQKVQVQVQEYAERAKHGAHAKTKDIEVVAQRMERSLDRLQEADRERDARIDALLDGQEALMEQLAMHPAAKSDSEASIFAPRHAAIPKVSSAKSESPLRLGGFGKKKKKKDKK